MYARTAILFALVSIALSTLASAWAAPVRGDKKDKELAKLVAQLGADNEDQRQEAAKKLTALGLAALPALQDAVQGNNADVKKQAQEIIKAIGAKAKKLVDDRLAKHSPNSGAVVRQMDDPALAEVFPENLFYVVIFRQYPVGFRPPAPLKVQNIFIVGKNNTLTHVTDVKGLVKFFRSTAAGVKEEKAVKQVARAWLDLAPEFHQDGYYKFVIPKDAVSVAKEGNGQKATGRAEVMPNGGNGGQVQATLLFDADGKLAKVAQNAQLRRGIRPICQATKLLDADPIVRRMAEKDILVMGRAAKDYLDEQRAKATPALRKAIDRVWKRIVDEGW
jgi:hypothetical protein